MAPAINIAGKTFGRLTVIERAENVPGGQARWKCRCECGRETIVTSQGLRKGLTKSCGCLHRDIVSRKRTSHGMTGTRVYRIWTSMMARCYNEANPSYNNYGAKGVRVCAAWHEFEEFFKDMGEPPAGASIDRILTDGNYEKENCRWADKNVQANNKRTTLFIEYAGRRQTLRAWADELGIKRTALYNRLYIWNWPLEKAMTRPVSNLHEHLPGESPNYQIRRARRILQNALKNGTVIKPDNCQHDGCTNTELQAHFLNGHEDEHALEVQWFCHTHIPRKRDLLLTWQGETKTVADWARSIGISPPALHARLDNAGWVLDENIFSAPRRGGVVILLDGKEMDVKEAAAHMGRSVATVYQHLRDGKLQTRESVEFTENSTPQE